MTRDELITAGFEVDAAAYERLAAYVAALLTANRELNLTGARDAATLWRVHVCDSLALVPRVAAAGVRVLIDLGSGGGLPGLPVACCCPSVRVTLLDATRKKVAALARIAAEAGVSNVATAWGRAERLAHQRKWRERADGLTARAVAALPLLIEYAAGLVRPGGVCWFFKSAAACAGEIAVAAAAARACRMEVIATEPYRLPGETEDRVLVAYRKTGPLDPRLPREQIKGPL